MLIYQAIFPNGKKYIGATSQTLDKRIKDHLAAMKRVDNKFYRAINKYGADNVVFKVIREFETKERMFLAEKILIERHNTQNNGYNTTIGGEGCSGIPLSNEARIKMSAAQKKRFSDPEQRRLTAEKTALWNKANPDKNLRIREKRLTTLRSKEHRIRASEKSKKVYKDNPKLIENMSKNMIQLYKNRPDVKTRISRSLGGRPIEVYKNGVYICTYETGCECVRQLKISHGNLSMVLKGKRRHTHGYTFKHGKGK